MKSVIYSHTISNKGDGQFLIKYSHIIQEHG